LLQRVSLLSKAMSLRRVVLPRKATSLQWNSHFRTKGNWGHPKELSPLSHSRPHADPGTAIQINWGGQFGIALMLPVHWVQDSPTPDATSATSDVALNQNWDFIFRHWRLVLNQDWQGVGPGLEGYSNTRCYLSHE